MNLARISGDICGLALATYVAYECVVAPRKYRRLKEAIAGGDLRARLRFYREILVFEWLSALLAAAALQFDPGRFRPAHLQIFDSAVGRGLVSIWGHFGPAFLVGMGIGVVVSISAAMVALRRARVRAPARTAGSSLSKFLPDFSALVPKTSRERATYVLVAISAGICEEMVFRAWLLDALHGAAGLTGAALVIIAAAIFGLGHYYQGIAGTVVTGVLGVAFCGLYVASGSLLAPIAVHVLLDLRVAAFPPKLEPAPAG